MPLGGDGSSGLCETGPTITLRSFHDPLCLSLQICKVGIFQVGNLSGR